MSRRSGITYVPNTAFTGAKSGLDETLVSTLIFATTLIGQGTCQCGLGMVVLVKVPKKVATLTLFRSMI